MLLNLLNLYSLIFALLNKIHGMTNELDFLKPELIMNVKVPNVPSNITYVTDNIEKTPIICFEEEIPCGPCEIHITFPVPEKDTFEDLDYITRFTNKRHDLVAENLLDQSILEIFMKHREIIESTKEKAMFENETSVFYDKYDNKNNTDDINYTDYTSYTDDSNSYDEMQSPLTTNYIENGIERKYNDLVEIITEDNSSPETDTSEYTSYSTDLYIDTSTESSSYINNFSTSENSISSEIETTENASTYNILFSEYSKADTNKIITYNFGTTSEFNDNRYNEFNDKGSEGNISNYSMLIPDDYSGFTKLESFTNELYHNTTLYPANYDSENTTIENENQTFILDSKGHSSINVQVDESEIDVSSTVTTYYQETENYSEYVNNISTGFTTTLNNREIEYTAITVNDAHMSGIETATTDFPNTDEPTLTTGTKLIKITTNTNMSNKTKESTNLKSPSSCNNTLTIERRCPDISFNCTLNCESRNITQVFFVFNCTVIQKTCYRLRCGRKTEKNGTEDSFSYIDKEPKCSEPEEHNRKKQYNRMDVAYKDEHDRTMYNLSKRTKKKLSKLCWETMFGQELVKLTMMDLVSFKKVYVTFYIITMRELTSI